MPMRVQHRSLDPSSAELAPASGRRCGRLWVEAVLLITGIACILPWTAAATLRVVYGMGLEGLDATPNRGAATVSKQQSLTNGPTNSDAASATAPAVSPPAQSGSAFATPVNWSEWDGTRQERFLKFLPGVPEPAAVLQIKRTGGNVAVFTEESELAMTLGAAYLEPFRGLTNHPGNLALSAHRDGSFRQLQHLKVGDELSLTETGRRAHYRITDISIVKPSDLSVLRDFERPTLTLITCYPFYFVGSAPQRYVVRAARVPSVAATDGDGAASASTRARQDKRDASS